MNLFLKLLFLALTSVSLNAHAEVRRCEGCGYAQMENLARASGVGLHSVFSIQGEVIRSFEVEYDREVGRFVAGEVLVPDEHVAGFAGLLAFGQRTNGAFKIVETVDVRNLNLRDGDKASVFNFVRDFGMQHRVAVQVHAYGQNVLTSQAPAAALAFLSQVDGTIEVTVVYPDGKIRMRVKANATIATREGPAEDAEGNPVAEQADGSAQGTYYYNSARSARDFYDHMRTLGAHIEAISGRSNTYSCTWDGRNLTCRRA